MNPIPNLHTHTFLCNHAVGQPSDYYEQAKKDGCSVLGFSDHCPYPESTPDYWPNIRMTLEDARSYVSDVQALKAKSFPVYLGFECEWDERLFNWYKDGLKGELGADYLVLGSHWLTRGDFHYYIPDMLEKSDLFLYTDQTVKGISSGLFAFLAHPDLCMAHGRLWDSDVEACMKEIIAASKSLNIPLEVNGLGLHKPMCRTENGLRYAYPVDEFWTLVAEEGAKIVCNADAHDPLNVIQHAREARDYASKFNLLPEDSLLA